jgi:hypothetical protein
MFMNIILFHKIRKLNTYNKNKIMIDYYTINNSIDSIDFVIQIPYNIELNLKE